MGANDCAVDHLHGIWNSSALVKSLQNIFPETGECPTPELSVNAGPFTKLFR
jgi:hypothetical protein